MVTTLVTGGSGFVGKNLKTQNPDWVYINSKDFDLKDLECCLAMLDKFKPDVVIHLAGRVGGIKDNLENPASFYYDNITINTNVVHACYLKKVSRLIASLSTCAFPDNLKVYPFREEDIFLGPPTKSNFSYGYAKRALLVQINAYRKQYGVNYSTFSPSNIYGPFDNFSSDKSHFVPAMIRKLISAKESSEVTFWGSGRPLRQQLYVEDLVEILPKLINLDYGEQPIIISPNENLSIKAMIDICLSILNKDIRVTFNNKDDGQFRKDGSNNNLKKLIGDFKFTTFEFGLRKTIDWYLNRKSSL
jgi:GDP-L-fucose synthase